MHMLLQPLNHKVSNDITPVPQVFGGVDYILLRSIGVHQLR